KCQQHQQNARIHIKMLLDRTHGGCWVCCGQMRGVGRPPCVPTLELAASVWADQESLSLPPDKRAPSVYHQYTAVHHLIKGYASLVNPFFSPIAPRPHWDVNKSAPGPIYHR